MRVQTGGPGLGVGRGPCSAETLRLPSLALLPLRMTGGTFQRMRDGTVGAVVSVHRAADARRQTVGGALFRGQRPPKKDARPGDTRSPGRAIVGSDRAG